MRAKELSITESEQLNEIDMSPKGLQQLASQIDARAGMEFEMIVPNVHQEDDEPEWEADYDQDQRTRSFDDIRSFFYDGDYNGRRSVDDLIEELSNEYREWQYEQSAEAWGRDGVDYLRDFVEVNDLFDRDEAMLQARDEVMDANPELPQESEDFSQLLSARLDALQEQFVLEAFEDQGRIYNDAFETFADEQQDEYDERSFLDDRYPYMTDVENNFDIHWPYYRDMNEGSGGELDVDQVADEFSSYMNKPVNASRSYHGARREPGHYVVEPDGSLEGDNPGDAGLEFVSPPMPVAELLSDLQKVKAWADKTGCYTNDSTGLHINVSVPGLRGVGETLDFVKLALLLGDERVLNEFGRAGNHYAKSAVEIVRKRVADQPEDAAALLTQMKGHLGNMASKAIHSGITNKYTSINTKDGYIEFRSPGGDWLGANFELIVPTLLRFVVALDAAIDPNKYRNEYLKKLYKLLTPKSEDDLLSYFAKFSAGELPKQALKSFVRQAQLQRKITKDPTGGKKYWWSVARPGYFASVEVVATTREEAIEKGKVEYPDWRNSTNMTAKPLRPYIEPEAPPAPAGNWGIFMTNADRFARAPGQIDNNVLRRFPSREAAEQFIAQAREQNSRMRDDIEVREIEPAAEAKSYNVTDASGYVMMFRATSPDAAEQMAKRQYPDKFRNVVSVVLNDQATQAFRSTENVPREGQPRNLVPTGPGPWEIYRISDNSAVRELSNTSRPEAEAEARNALGLRGEAPELYGVRTRQPATQAPRTLTRPGQGQQTFTGEWKIVDPQGREIHRFGGIGNAQADANRVAIQWLQRNSVHMQDGVEVLPVMESE